MYNIYRGKGGNGVIFFGEKTITQRNLQIFISKILPLSALSKRPSQLETITHNSLLSLALWQEKLVKTRNRFRFLRKPIWFNTIFPAQQKEFLESGKAQARTPTVDSKRADLSSSRRRYSSAHSLSLSLRERLGLSAGSCEVAFFCARKISFLPFFYRSPPLRFLSV